MGGTYSSDTLPVDDEAFLNGGLPEPVDTLETNDMPVPAPALTPEPTPEPEPTPVPTPKPAPEFVPGEARIVKKDMLSTNDSPQKSEPEIAKPVSSIDSTEAPTPDVSEEAPVPPKVPEVIEDTKPEAAASEKVSIQPSASFEEEMKEEGSKESSSFIGAGNMIGQPYKPQEERTRPEHHQMSHVAGITPSQSMIPDGMLADNRVSLDGDDGGSDEVRETMIPSQAMAETFTAQPAELPSLHGDLPGEDGVVAEGEADDIDDDEPIVVGPVISSAGMESLSDQQAENPTTNVQATTMKIEAPIDENEIPDDLKDETPSTETPKFDGPKQIEEDAAETKPAEAPATAEKPAETTTESAPATESVAPKAEESTAEAKPTEMPAATETSATTDKPAEPAAAPALATTPTPATSSPAAPVAGNAGKKSNMTPIIIAAIAGIVLLVGGIIAAISIFSNLGNNEEEVVAEDKYGLLVPNSDGKFAVFSIEGEKLTDYEYSLQLSFSSTGYPSSFKNVTEVKNSDGAVGAIDTEGKVVVEFGKYDYLSAYNSKSSYLYALKDNQMYFMNNKGELIVGPEDGVIFGAGDDDTLAVSNKDEGKIKIFNSKKKELWSIDCGEKCPTKISSADASYSGNILFFDGKIRILDLKAGKEILSVKADAKYNKRYANTETNTYYFEKSTSKTDDNGYSIYKHIFIVNGKETKPEKDCVRLQTITKDDGDHFSCMIDGKQYWLNDDLTLGVQLADKSKSVMNGDTYAEISGTGVKFYAKGKQVKKIDTGNYKMPYDAMTTKADYYILQRKCQKSECDYADYSGYVYEYYTASGTKMTSDYYNHAGYFNTKNGLAIVGKDSRDFYLINKKGKQVGGNYYYLSEENGFEEGILYTATSTDRKGKKSYIIGGDGKVINEVTGTGSGIHLTYFDKKLYYVFPYGDDEEMAYDEAGKEILPKGYKYVTLGDGFIECTNDLDKIDYYAMNGVKLTTIERKWSYYGPDDE
jgi:hypothetical protein